MTTNKQHPIPPATLAAGDHADPDWWLACADFHEGWAEAAGATEQERAYNSAAALACRTFALMMRRAADGTELSGIRWRVSYDGDAMALPEPPGVSRTLPAAAVAALTEGE